MCRMARQAYKKYEIRLKRKDLSPALLKELVKNNQRFSKAKEGNANRLRLFVQTPPAGTRDNRAGGGDTCASSRRMGGTGLFLWGRPKATQHSSEDGVTGFFCM